MANSHKQLMQATLFTKGLLLATLFFLIVGFAVIYLGTEDGKSGELVEARSVQVGVNWNARQIPTPTPRP